MKAQVNPQAYFTSPATSAHCPPVTIQFMDTSKAGSSGIKQWFWDFGDGTVSNQRNPSKEYKKAGVYSVGLKIVDSMGNADSVMKKDYITVTAPTATFTLDKHEGCLPLTVKFTYNSPDTIESYLISAGDGFGSLITHSYTYSSRGKYIPTLKITEAKTHCSQIIRGDTITVYPLPYADFTWHSSGRTVDFTPYDTTAYSYTWMFGDGDSSGLKSPQHIYAKDGKYVVWMKAINEFGCKQQRFDTVSVIATGIEAKTINSNGWKIYPNPAKNKITVESQVKLKKGAVAILYDATGKEVLSAPLNSAKTEIDLPSSITPGMYTLKIMAGQTINEKIMIR